MKPSPVAFKMAPAEMMQQETHVSKAYPGGAEPRLWRSKATILAQEGTASMHSQQQPGSHDPGAPSHQGERASGTTHTAAQLV